MADSNSAMAPSEMFQGLPRKPVASLFTAMLATRIPAAPQALETPGPSRL